MRYINLRFTYLLTYNIASGRQKVEVVNAAERKSPPAAAPCSYNANVCIRRRGQVNLPDSGKDDNEIWNDDFAPGEPVLEGRNFYSADVISTSLAQDKASQARLQPRNCRPHIAIIVHVLKANQTPSNTTAIKDQ